MADSRTSFDRWVKEVGVGAVAGLVDAVGGRGFVRSNEAPVDAARRLLAEPDAASHIVGSLPPLAREIFFRLLDCGGVARADLLIDLVARHTSSDDAVVTKDAQMLAKRGLLLFTRHSWMWLLYQPTYVRDVFAGLLDVWRREARRTHGVIRAGESVSLPIGPLLAAIAAEPLRLTQQREVFRRQRLKLDALLGGDAARIDVALRFADGADWLVARDDQRGVGRAGVARYAALAPDAKLAFHLAVLEQCWPGAFQALAYLSREDRNEWVSLERLIVRIDVLSRLRGGYVSPSASPETVSFWTSQLVVAAGLGLAEMSGTDYARLTAAFRSLAEFEPHAATPDARNKPLLVQPNFEVFAAASTPLDVWARLGSVARLVAVDAVSRFAIDATSIRGGVANGENAASILAFLGEQSAHGIPQNVEATIRGWAEQAGAIRFFRGLVVRCEAEKDAAIARAAGGNEIASGTFVFDDRDEDRVRAALAKAGLRALPPTIESADHGYVKEPLKPGPAMARFATLRLQSETIEVQVDDATKPAADETSLARLLARAFGRDEAARLLAALRPDEVAHFESLILTSGALYVGQAVRRRVEEKADVPRVSLTDPAEIRRTLERLVESPDETEVHIEYARNRNSTPQSFRIAAMDLFERGGTTFIEAYDLGSDENRLFEIARIRSLTVADDDAS
ncbi:MAG: helicase-associated domain-containing protein [Planctomycetes bacterium]|nr:helicase-associated domain-containing protein [Planctomycetota bacterium]